MKREREHELDERERQMEREKLGKCMRGIYISLYMLMFTVTLNFRDANTIVVLALE